MCARAWSLCRILIFIGRGARERAKKSSEARQRALQAPSNSFVPSWLRVRHQIRRQHTGRNSKIPIEHPRQMVSDLKRRLTRRHEDTKKSSEARQSALQASSNSFVPSWLRVRHQTRRQHTGRNSKIPIEHPRQMVRDLNGRDPASQSKINNSQSSFVNLFISSRVSASILPRPRGRSSENGKPQEQPLAQAPPV